MSVFFIDGESAFVAFDGELNRSLYFVDARVTFEVRRGEEREERDQSRSEC